jgi:hypothetical protein
MQAVAVVERRDHQLLGELWIFEILPRARRRPLVVVEGFLRIHDAGADHAEADRLVRRKLHHVVEIVVDRRLLKIAAETERDRLVHRPVIDDGDVDLLVAFLRLQFRQRVGRVAGHVLDLHAVLLFERRDDVPAHRLLE